MRYMKQHRSTKGFTIIELMIVVTIIAIITMLAVPAYSSYMIRAKIAECVNNAASSKLAISEYYQTLGTWPPTLVDAGLLVNSGASKYCVGIKDYEQTTGGFAIDINESTVDSTLTNTAPVLTPTISDGRAVNWTCSSGTTPVSEIKYLPPICRDS